MRVVPTPSRVVTLLTDFGASEPFVGVMKGVILRIAPSLGLVDLTHGIPAHDVQAAAFWLARAVPWFPPGTTHLAVVDPGVGTARRALAAECGGHYFVAPDNGILSGVLDASASVVSAPVAEGASSTFHGRDVFAPVAARIASGQLTVEHAGTRVDDWLRLPSEPVAGRSGRVVVIDHFGNLISDVAALPTDRGSVRVGNVRVPLVSSYQLAHGALGALVNAWGVVEVFVDRGRAVDRLSASVGTPITFEPDP